jgi:hypothetical protein
MDTDTMYAPKTPESTLRSAALHAAKAWQTESITCNPVAGDIDLVWVFELSEERWASGCQKFGREMLVRVTDGDCTNVTDTEG